MEIIKTKKYTDDEKQLMKIFDEVNLFYGQNMFRKASFKKICERFDVHPKKREVDENWETASDTIAIFIHKKLKEKLTK